VNGPIRVAGIAAGEALAVHVEAIAPVEPFVAPNGGPFYVGMGPRVPLDYRDGYLHWPQGFRLKARPSVGNLAVLPAMTPELEALLRSPRRGLPAWRRLVNDPRGKHCHQDCPWLGAGAVLHIRAQVDGGGLCAGDVHVYQGQGELAFDGIGAAAAVRLRVERSAGWLVDWPLVETPDEIMVCVSGSRYVDVVRQAYWSLREVIAARAGCTIPAANSIVASAIDLRNCAIYGLGDGYISGTAGRPSSDLAVVAAIPKEVARPASNTGRSR
jgi:acetamidase/formamidase